VCLYIIYIYIYIIVHVIIISRLNLLCLYKLITTYSHCQPRNRLLYLFKSHRIYIFLSFAVKYDCSRNQILVINCYQLLEFNLETHNFMKPINARPKSSLVSELEDIVEGVGVYPLFPCTSAFFLLRILVSHVARSFNFRQLSPDKLHYTVQSS